MNIIKSSLYIDFDNMAIPLMKEGFLTGVMDKFSSILDYLSTAEISNDLYPSNSKRVFYKKIIFFNPQSFGKYKITFMENGFLTTECSVTTKSGKTSTDMFLCVELIKDLYTKDFEDYVIISSDVDFAPALLHINAHGKRTIQLGIGLQNHIIQGSAMISLNSSDLHKYLFKSKPKEINLNPQVNIINIKKDEIEKENEKETNKLEIEKVEPKLEIEEKKEQKEIITSPKISEFIPPKIISKPKVSLVNAGLPDLDDKLKLDVIKAYKTCIEKDVKKRSILTSVFKFLRENYHIKKSKNDDTYEKVVSLVRFIGVWLKVEKFDKNNLIVNELIDDIISNFLNSQMWERVRTSFHFTPMDIHNYFLKEDKM